jgi:hypothetical protein
MKTKSKNSIPRAVDPVTSLGAKALIGGQSIGALIPLVINTPPKIATDFYDFAGNPATPEIRGKQAKYAAQKTVVTDAYAAARQAVSAGRDFCMDAISVLKPVLGNRWNSQWNRAGFVAPSLAVERDPVPMLIRLREYFNANAAQEVASRGVTAAQAQVRVAAIQAADLAVAQARDLRTTLKTARDESLAALRSRLSGLREELGQLLSDEDGRWYDFGFSRPVDGSIPSPVTGLTLTAGGAGIVLVNCAPSTRATNYRVMWRASSSGDPATPAGLFTGPQCTLTGLPSGVPIIVGVSARNASGETAIVEATIVVP